MTIQDQSRSAEPLVIDYHINDNTRGEEDRRYRVEVEATREELRQLVEQGYMLRRGLFPDSLVRAFGEALDRVSAAEIDDPRTELLANNGHYLRSLIDKDPIFTEVLRNRAALSIGRALLGPQVWFDIEGRIAFADVPGQKVSWHIHLRVVPDPLPPFFVYPHAIHCLLYLDDVDQDSGPICLLPGSHRWLHYDIPPGDDGDKPGQVILPVKGGDCLFMHGNVWHRTLPSRPGCPKRRLLLFGYTPAWIRSDLARGVRVDETTTRELRRTGNREMRELLGEYYW